MSKQELISKECTPIDCYIGLGSNLSFQSKTPKQLIKAALDCLQKTESITLKKHSSIYISKAHGPQDQDHYHNAVACIGTALGAEVLLNKLHDIEHQLGLDRSSKRYWGERCMDLDILLYGQEHINTQELSVPHPFLEQREFVLLPLYEIAPKLSLPNGKDIKTLAEICPRNGIIKLER